MLDKESLHDTFAQYKSAAGAVRVASNTYSFVASALIALFRFQIDLVEIDMYWPHPIGPSALTLRSTRRCDQHFAELQDNMTSEVYDELCRNYGRRDAT